MFLCLTSQFAEIAFNQISALHFGVTTIFHLSYCINSECVAMIMQYKISLHTSDCTMAYEFFKVIWNANYLKFDIGGKCIKRG